MTAERYRAVTMFPHNPVSYTHLDVYKRQPKPLGEPIHKQITPILIRRNTTQ